MMRVRLGTAAILITLFAGVSTVSAMTFNSTNYSINGSISDSIAGGQ